MNGIQRLIALVLLSSAGMGLAVACGPSEEDNAGTAGCQFDADCQDGEACEAAVCVPTCVDAAADCGPGEVCEPGLDTELLVCQAGMDNNQPDNNEPTNNMNNPPGQTYIAARVQSEASGDAACAITDPGPDIYAIGLEDTGGTPLGWGRHVANAVQFDGNDHVDTSHLDGSAPGLDADLCPDQFDGNVVALGCDPESWLAVEFIDDGGNIIPLVGDDSLQIVVYEYGAQCGGTVVDEYRIDVCTDIEGVRAGDSSSCTITLGSGFSAIGIGAVSGF